MADVNRGNRPLSPHLQIYRLPLTAMLSITHRITGVGLALGLLLVIWWLFAASTGPLAFAVADGVLTSLLGRLVLIGSLWALCYHFCNGIRHLFWDAGMGFDLAVAQRANLLVLVGSVVLALIVLLLA